MISVIITTHNEGDELVRTVDSIRENTDDFEILVVDDGGTDDSVARVSKHCKVVSNDKRIGIAYSRNRGVDACNGDVVAFYDGHQRVAPGTINECAKLARETGGNVWPSNRGLGDNGWTIFGAWMRLQDHHRKKGFFGARFNRRQPRDRVTRIGTMSVPAYAMTKQVFNEKVRLIEGLRGWGASEPALSVKAFFADVPIFGLRADFHKDGRWKRGPFARHMYRGSGNMPFRTSFYGVSRNHLAIARVCFSEDSFNNYWRKVRIFRRKLDHKGANGIQQVYEQFTPQHEAFQKIKKRPDTEFWRGLMLEDKIPRGIKD